MEDFMKICIPTQGKNGLKEMVFGHFGSAKFFTIYDTEKKTIEIVENKNEHHDHGTCHPIGAIAGYNVDVILSGGMGRRAVQMLNEGGLKVFLMDGSTVADAVKNFEENKLSELTVDNACGGHGCH
jgi:predicted Fe-Mo cluster-binding NifX family protein